MLIVPSDESCRGSTGSRAGSQCNKNRRSRKQSPATDQQLSTGSANGNSSNGEANKPKSSSMDAYYFMNDKDKKRVENKKKEKKK